MRCLGRIRGEMVSVMTTHLPSTLVAHAGGKLCEHLTATQARYLASISSCGLRPNPPLTPQGLSHHVGSPELESWQAPGSRDVASKSPAPGTASMRSISPAMRVESTRVVIADGFVDGHLDDGSRLCHGTFDPVKLLPGRLTMRPWIQTWSPCRSSWKTSVELSLIHI